MNIELTPQDVCRAVRTKISDVHGICYAENDVDIAIGVNFHPKGQISISANVQTKDPSR